MVYLCKKQLSRITLLFAAHFSVIFAHPLPAGTYKEKAEYAKLCFLNCKRLRRGTFLVLPNGKRQPDKCRISSSPVSYCVNNVDPTYFVTETD